MTAKRKKGVDESLTAALARLLEKTILPDLAERAKTPAVAAVLIEQHARERAQARTADAFVEWTPRWIEQVGAAWILSCVFLRTLEDRGLVRHHRRIAGDGAADAEQLFFEVAPSLTARDYLLVAFHEVAHHPSAEDLLGRARNPAFRLSPSNEGARALLDFFRERDGDERGNSLRWRFEGTDTRFLGDLYQDLSAAVRERYALLQTPDFVEEFILNLTLDPAIATYGLEETHLLDPTCGSGHFLLGAFDRICEHRMRTAPGLDAKEHALAALGQVHGVDLNPYAVFIARFRLTLAYLLKAGLKSLAEAPRRLPIEVVVADSLLHGVVGTTRRFSELGGQNTAAWGQPIFELEDQEAADRVFGRKYQAVVGNPPYIVPRDDARKDEYRKHYRACYRGYALSAPFMERFFHLAIDGGHVGMINANSFAKREFGKKVIEDVLAHWDITRVIDTSGAHIPGHGTPTVLLFGRCQPPISTTIRSILGKRGEPATTSGRATGLVWASIAAHFDDASYEDQFLSVVDVPRSTFAKHPWSFGGGGAAELKKRLEERAHSTLGKLVAAIGRTTVCGEDDVWIIPSEACRRITGSSLTVPLVIGEAVRDWAICGEPDAIYPYSSIGGSVVSNQDPVVIKYLWLYKSILRSRTVFGKTLEEKGASWFSHLEHYIEKLRTRLFIVFAFISTHNHFVLDRGGKIFNRSAPVIKLPDAATEEDHLALLGYLNSSTACFWMKQVCMGKHMADGGEAHADPAAQRFEFDGTKLQSVPLAPAHSEVVPIVHQLLKFAESREACMPAALLAKTEGIDPSGLDFYEQHADIDFARMCALQEELDWVIYDAFGLLTDADRALLRRTRGEALPDFPRFIDLRACAVRRQGLYPGHRPFEIALVRDCLKEDRKTAWFERNSYRSPSEVLDTYAPAYQRLLASRVAIIDRNPNIRLLEQPEYKRRWKLRDWRGELRSAVRTRVAEIAESEARKSTSPRSARRLTESMAKRAASLGLEGLLSEGAEGVRTVLLYVLVEDAVPYLAAHRYTPEGLERRDQWEHAWALQRREDAGEQLSAPIPIPPKYDAKDFRDPNYFRLRGKLDVPKERFISYPGAEKDDDPSPLFGWAGWNHLERATALAGLYQERKTEDGWGKDRLTPLLAGLLELIPWLKQWHNDLNEEFGEHLGDYYERYVETEARALGLTLDALRAWRPEAKGRKTRAKKEAL